MLDLRTRRGTVFEERHAVGRAMLHNVLYEFRFLQGLRGRRRLEARGKVRIAQVLIGPRIHGFACIVPGIIEQHRLRCAIAEVNRQADVHPEATGLAIELRTVRIGELNESARFVATRRARPVALRAGSVTDTRAEPGGNYRARSCAACRCAPDRSTAAAARVSHGLTSLHCGTRC